MSSGTPTFAPRLGNNGEGSGGKGGLFGGGGGAQSYTYYADLIMLACEGPINSIGYVYKNQSIFFLFQLGLGNYNGTTPQTTWPYLAALYPYNALAYQGTALNMARASTRPASTRRRCSAPGATRASKGTASRSASAFRRS
jgi:hypothetical protein